MSRLLQQQNTVDYHQESSWCSRDHLMISITNTYLQRALKRQVRSLRRICNMCVLGIQRMKQMQIRIDSLSTVKKMIVWH
ncbi:Hypp1049 [Branchiostoma lanceolatum]|uniref:Hypp1049 protein n=1 Tax=Branchiostoma lanceolatum TaxID=7740 RepID=A0A8J9ZE81_BRALA|nr:Hypp1049 [Branchiostoma lanceolatum]